MDRVFADGTVADGGKDFPMDEIPVSVWESLLEVQGERRVLESNPSAASVDRREKGAPWRIAGEREVREERKKAEPEMFRKRMFGLARQSCRGLESNYGAHFDPSDLAALLTAGFHAKEKAREAEERGRKRRGIALEALRNRTEHRDGVLGELRRVEAELKKAKEEVEGLVKAREEEEGKKGKKAKKGKKEEEVAGVTEEEVEEGKRRVVELEREVGRRREVVEEAEEGVREAEGDVERVSEERKGVVGGGEETRLVQLYDAALKFDLQRLLNLLNLKDTRPFDKTMTGLWGSPKKRGKERG